MWLFQYDLSVITLIGLILLIGIVKKNAIMMVDVALGLQREQADDADAIFKASLLRFRPIMMTTMCALLGAIPLLVSSGAGSELRRPLGVAVIGGLLVSQFVTLYTVPIIFLTMDRLAKGSNGRGAAAKGRQQRVLSRGNGDALTKDISLMRSKSHLAADLGSGRRSRPGFDLVNFFPYFARRNLRSTILFPWRRPKFGVRTCRYT